jgi:hypothetical protein
MSNGRHVDAPAAIVDRVDRAVVADPDAPEIHAALELPATWRARVESEPLDPLEHAGSQRLVQTLALRAKVIA